MSALGARKVSRAADFGRVALLVGGDSAEREVSLDGGAAIARSLSRSDIHHEVFDGALPLFDAIRDGRIDRVFNLMHGPGGEDGSIQGALALMHVRCTGSGVLGSALSMDKVRSKWIFERQGVCTAPFVALGPGEGPPGDLLDQFGLPLFVKPTGLGSSIGVSRVAHAADLPAAIELARDYGDVVVIEPAIVGSEYFAGVIGRTVLPLIRIETPRAFYDYEAKYHSDETAYFCPSGLDPGLEERLQEASLRAFDAVQASGWGRVDFILDAQEQPWFLEVNTVPGMTDHSLVPQAAEVIGVGFDELVWRILETSL